MCQICWNNLHLSNLSSFQESVIAHPDSHECHSLLCFGGCKGYWKRKFGMVTAIPVLQPCPKSELSQAKVGSGPWHSLTCPTGLSSALTSALEGCWLGCALLQSDDANDALLSSPCAQDQGRLRGTAGVWGLFSQSYHKFLQCEPLTFSKTQAERTC